MDFFPDLFKRCAEAAEHVKISFCKETACSDLPYVALFITDDKDVKNALRLPPEAEIPGSDGRIMMSVPISGRDPYGDEVMQRLVPPFKADAVCIVSEGYCKPQELPEGYKRGDMQKEYESDPFSEVKPALVLLAVDLKTQKSGMLLLPYKYDDRGVPTFDVTDRDKIMMHDAEGVSVGGRAFDAIMKFARLYRAKHG